MREIKYKARRVDNGKWVEGHFMVFNDRCYFNKWSYGPDFPELDSKDFYEVHSETVCQYIKTVDGVDIYENDKLKIDEDLSVYCLIEWCEKRGAFIINVYGYGISYGEGSQEIISDNISKYDENIYDIEDISVEDLIGNIHD